MRTQPTITVVRGGIDGHLRLAARRRGTDRRRHGPRGHAPYDHRGPVRAFRRGGVHLFRGGSDGPDRGTYTSAYRVPLGVARGQGPDPVNKGAPPATEARISPPSGPMSPVLASSYPLVTALTGQSDHTKRSSLSRPWSAAARPTSPLVARLGSLISNEWAAARAGVGFGLGSAAGFTKRSATCFSWSGSFQGIR